jgi:CheY-like chemotaxis protein
MSAVRKLRILLVDDVEMNRRLAGYMLKGSGYEVDEVESGAAALEALNANRYDLVLLDVQMPEMDGYEAAARIRMLPRPVGAVPILALTANAMPDEIRRCLDAGMNGHVSKPIDKAALLRAVTDYTVRAQAMSDLPAS